MKHIGSLIIINNVNNNKSNTFNGVSIHLDDAIVQLEASGLRWRIRIHLADVLKTRTGAISMQVESIADKVRPGAQTTKTNQILTRCNTATQTDCE